MSHTRGPNVRPTLTGEDMSSFIKIMAVGSFAALALAGCKQENNYPSTDTTTASTTVVPVPGPTVAMPVPGATATVTATPGPAETPAQ